MLRNGVALYLVQQVQHQGGGSSSTGTDAGYTGAGPYSTGGGPVDVEAQLGGTGDGTIDGGTSNDGGSNISKTLMTPNKQQF